ncbi:MAG: ATP synthase F1 subunit epsilon [Symbiobacteriaceae bacterium]|nr:ATP synthase F1 subunit epsilon [Symbiobacteriaceae bacterium]
MSDKKIHLKIVTPTEVKIDEKVDMVVMRCVDGAMGILPGHMPLSTALDYGIARIMNKDGERRIAVFGGIAQIKNDELVILTNEASWPEEIDLAQAQQERESASESIRMHVDSLAVQRSQVQLRRSLVAIEVSSYTLVSKTRAEEK